MRVDAYERDWNAGFATEVVLVDSYGMVVYHSVSTFNKAAEIDVPDLIGDPFDSTGFREITDEARVNEIIEQERAEEQLEVDIASLEPPDEVE